MTPPPICDCGSGLPVVNAGKYCIECSPMDCFCDDCPDFDACEFACKRPPQSEGEPSGNP